jgi:general stress protein YciG
MTFTRQTAGKKGGKKTAERHGRDHFVRIGSKGGKSRRRKAVTQYSDSLPS